MTDEIAKTFNVMPLADYKSFEEANEVTVVEEVSEKTEFLDDADKVKDNLKRLMDQGEDVFEEIINLAKTSEQPRAYEVAATIMKTLLDANKDFIDTSRKKHEMMYGKNEGAAPAATSINNSQVIMTTSEILKQIKEGK